MQIFEILSNNLILNRVSKVTETWLRFIKDQIIEC